MTYTDSISSLQNAWAHSFRVGAAIETYLLEDSARKELIKRHFSSITAENAMKWELFQSEEGYFNTQPADRIADFARSNRISLRGHTLIWHRQTPRWLFSGLNGPHSAIKLEERLESHAEKLLDRYRDIAVSWDVLNEILDPEGPEGFRESPWLEYGSPDLFVRALEIAHRIVPNARLYYNDYGIEEGHRFENAFRYCSRLLDRGVPLHGVGIEGHWYLDEPREEVLRSALEKYTSLGVEISLTAVDLSFYRSEDHTTRYASPPDGLLAAQTKKYCDIFRIAADYPAVTNVTTWGLTDRDTWLDYHPIQGRKNWPLLFTAECQAKPALNLLLDTGYSLSD